MVAFLEAQVLNESFRALGQAEDHEPKAKPCVCLGRRRGVPTIVGFAAAAAAMVMASFAIGWMSHGSEGGAGSRFTGW